MNRVIIKHDTGLPMAGGEAWWLSWNQDTLKAGIIAAIVVAGGILIYRQMKRRRK